MSIKNLNKLTEYVNNKRSAMSDQTNSTQINLNDEIVSNKDNSIINEVLKIEDYVNLISREDITKFKNNNFNDIIELKKDLNKKDLKATILSYIYMEKLKDNNLSLKQQNDFIYYYNNKNYEKIEDTEINKFLNNIMINSNYINTLLASNATFKKIFEIQIKTNLEYIKTLDNKKETFINLNNGVLKVDSNGAKLLKHNAKYNFTYCLNYNYNIKSDASIWKRFLNEVLDKDTQTTLKQYLGYIFTKGLKLEKCLFLDGMGGNGKGVIFEVVSAIFGIENITFFGLNELTGTAAACEYNKAMLANKFLNYGSEIGKNGKIDIDTFKKLVSSEATTARLPYKEPFTITNLPKFIFNANGLMSVQSSDLKAVLRRLVIIPFTKNQNDFTIDRNLHNKIINNELSGVLNWILEGVQEVLTNQDIFLSNECLKAIDAYEFSNDSILSFLKVYLENLGTNVHNAFIPIKPFYSSYKVYCLENSKIPLSNNLQFQKGLESALVKLEFVFEYKEKTKEFRKCYKITKKA